MYSYQFHNKCTNKTNHTSSRVPYLSSISKTQKGFAQLWYFFWQLHLHNKSFILQKHSKYKCENKFLVFFEFQIQFHVIFENLIVKR